MPERAVVGYPLRRLKGPLQGCRVDVLRALSRRHQPPRVSWQSAPVSSHRLGDRELLSRGGHHSGTFGIRRIHLDGSLDLEFAVECEEASCNVAGYKCPVLGLAVSDEGRRQLTRGRTVANACLSTRHCKVACEGVNCWGTSRSNLRRVRNSEMLDCML